MSQRANRRSLSVPGFREGYSNRGLLVPTSLPLGTKTLQLAYPSARPAAPPSEGLRRPSASGRRLLCPTARTMPTMPGVLEKLEARVANSTDLVLIREVRRCFDARAYRAAYVMTWLATAESLKAKFIVMGNRDSQIGRVSRQLEQMEAQRKPTDSFVLDKAKEFGLLSPDEHVKLDHMLTMRNVYAHPLGAAPERVEVLAAISVAVECVLSRPPLLRHGYATEVVRSLLEDRHFLDDVESAIDEHARAVAARLNPIVVPFLFEKLTQGLEALAGDPESAVFWRRGVRFAGTFLETASPDFASDEWDLAQRSEQCPRACSQVLSGARIWPLLPRSAQDAVLGHLVEPHKRGGGALPLQSTDVRRALSLRDEDLLTTRQRARLSAALASAPYDVLRSAAVSLRDYLDKVIDDLSSHDWYTQNPAANAVEHAGHSGVAELSPDNQVRLGRSILQAADGQSNGAAAVLAKVEQSVEHYPRDFVLGIFLECFTNELGQFRLKKHCLFTTLRLAIQHPQTEELWSQLLASVESSEPKYAWGEEYSDAMRSVEEAIRTGGVPVSPTDELIGMLRDKAAAHAGEPWDSSIA